MADSPHTGEVAVQVHGDGAAPGETGARMSRQHTRWVEASALPLLFLIVVVVFGVIEPSTFISIGNAASVFGTNTVLLLVTAAVLLPLILGEFDLSVGAVAGLSAMVTATVNVEYHLPILLAVLVALAAVAMVGALNALLIVLFDNNSFIVTLAMGTAVTGIVYWISASETISGTSAAFSTWVFGNTFLGIPLEFYYGLAIMLVAWYVLEMTPLGQRMTFVGQSRAVATLSGIRVRRIRVLTFIAAALIAGLAGAVQVGTAGSANPTNGPDLLLPAFAAAFLGSTTIRPGRSNVAGAVIAVYFLAVGIDGLELLGVQNYVHDIFYGVALVVAVTSSQLLKRRFR
jgi:ribose transport system permease protein